MPRSLISLSIALLTALGLPFQSDWWNRKSA
jgi:hypothetical protein